jgi:capsular polysaccharide biosynthesis protein
LDHSEIDLRQLFQVLRRRLVLLIAIPVIAGLVAGVVSTFLLDPVYSAETTLWVIKNDSSQLNYNDLLLSRNLTKTYSEVATSRAVMADVISTLALSTYTVTQLQAKVTVTPVKDTEIIAFVVEDKDPAQAALIANAVADSFKKQIRDFMQVENVAVVDRAMIPTSPVKPRKLMNVAVAVVLGAMAAVGIVLLMEYLDTTLKTQDDVSRHLGLPVLGLIPVITAGETAEIAIATQPTRSRRRRRKEVAKV